MGGPDVPAHHQRAFRAQPALLLRRQGGDEPSTNGHHSPPGDARRAGQRPPDGAGGTRMTGEPGHLAIGEDIAWLNPQDHPHDLLLEHAHGHMIGAQGQRR